MYKRKISQNGLKPTLYQEDVVLLDDSSVHKSKLVRDTLTECGIKYSTLT